MKETSVSHVISLFTLVTCVLVLSSLHSVVSASSQPVDSIHFCVPFDYEQWLRDNTAPAGKRTADLKVGAPRTVRMIYFLPSDRPFRAEVVDSMKTSIRRIQTFYAEQMQAHGYGNRAFRFETDGQGEPLVHRMDGQHPDSRYLDDTYNNVMREEVEQEFDVRENIYFVVIDNSTKSIGVGTSASRGRGGFRGKTGGFALVPGAFGFETAAHELGHAFGLGHDFNDHTYIMSYGGGSRRRLSACNAEFLAVHPYINSDIPIEKARGPTIEIISPRTYPAGSKSVSILLGVSDSEGLHQVILFVPTRGISLAAGSREVKACRGFAGKQDAVVEFEYDGNIPSSAFSSLSNSDVDRILFWAIDKDGDVGRRSFDLEKMSPYHIATLQGHVRTVNSVSFSPDGSILASGSKDSTILLWDVAKREQIANLEGHTDWVTSVVFSPDGMTLASGSRDKTVKLWDVATGQNIATLGQPSWVTSVVFSPDGTTLAAGSGDKTVKLWDAATGRNIATLGQPSWVTSLVFSPDGTTLAAGLADGTIVLWDVGTRGQIATVEGHNESWVSSVSFSPDGTTLASAGDNTVKVWDVATREQIAALEGHTSWIRSVVFSPDGATLASGSRDKTVKLWDAATGQNIATLGQPSWVNSVVFSPDGTILASGLASDSSDSGAGAVRLWDASAWMQPRPRTLVKISGDNQQGTSGNPLVNPLVVEVRDQHDNPLPGARVTFTVTAGDGRLTERFTVEKATTDANGRAEPVLTLGPNPGTNTVEVTVAGLEVTFNSVGVGAPTTPSMDGDHKTWNLPNGAMMRLGKGRLAGGTREIAFSPDGQGLAVASDTGIWLYDVATARALALLPTAFGVRSVSFSPDGTTLASAGDNTVKVWDVATREQIAALEGHTSWIRSVVFSPDGATLASGSRDKTVKLWDAATGQNIATLGHPSWVNSVVFSPDGTTLASGSGDRTIRLWDVKTGSAASLEGHTAGVRSVVFSPDGTTLASAGDNTLRIWDVATGQNIATLQHTSWVNSVSFSPDGTTLASGLGDATILLWDVATGQNIATLQHTSWVNSVLFSPDGTTLAAGSKDRAILLWDVETESVASLEGHTTGVRSVVFSPNATTLASGLTYGTVELWDATTGTEIATLERHAKGVRSVVFSPDGMTLASGSDDKTVKLWDVATGQNIATLGHPSWVYSVVFSPDGATLASGLTDGTVKLWDVATREQVATLEGHAKGVRSVVFSPDGMTLASGSDDKTVKLWDVATRKQIGTLEGHNESWVKSVSFSPDGTILASGGDKTVKLWDVATVQDIATLEHESRVRSVVFSAYWTILASGLTDGTVKLWDVATREQIANLEGHTGYVNTVSFSPDGTILASGSNDGTILLWDLEFLQLQLPTFTKLSGDNQQGPAGAQLAEPFVVSVLDQNGLAYAGAVVTFSVTAGKGTLSVGTATTDSSGQAASTLTLGALPGPNTVEVTVAGLKPVTFAAVGKATPDFDGNGVVGFSDFVQFAAKFGLSQGDAGYEARYDLDKDGAIGFGDFLIFANAFGA